MSIYTLIHLCQKKSEKSANPSADCIEAITDWIIDIEDIKKLGLPRCLEFDLEEVYKRTKEIKEEKYTAQCNIS